MKKFFLFIGCIGIGTLYAEEIVSFKEVKEAAEYYAQYIFEEKLQIIDSQVYYGVDNLPIAYYFVFSEDYTVKEQIEQEVLEGWNLLKEIRHSRNKELMSQAWKKIRGENRYKTLAISSRYYYPPLIYYWDGLPPHYVMSVPIKERGTIQKYIFFSPYDIWAQVVTEKDTLYISVFSLNVERREEILTLSVLKMRDGIESKALETWNDIKNNEILTSESFRIQGVPDYQWSYGCSPTASAMLLGYWDAHGYSKLVDYYFDHYDVILQETVEDVPNCQKQLAIAMNTDTIAEGTTYVPYIAPGTEAVCNNPEWGNNYNFVCKTFYNNHEKLIQMINGYHPVHWMLIGHPTYKNHSVCAIGWGPPDQDYICIHDTWETTPEEVVIAFDWGSGYTYTIPLGRTCEVALTEGITDISPALMDINGDETQEIFLACDDGNEDGKGKACAYTLDWDLMWSKDIQGDIGANLGVSDLGFKKSFQKRKGISLLLGITTYIGVKNWTATGNKAVGIGMNGGVKYSLTPRLNLKAEIGTFKAGLKSGIRTPLGDMEVVYQILGLSSIIIEKKWCSILFGGGIGYYSLSISPYAGTFISPYISVDILTPIEVKGFSVESEVGYIAYTCTCRRFNYLTLDVSMDGFFIKFYLTFNIRRGV